MKTLTILLLLTLSCCCNAQTFIDGSLENYTFIQIEIDPYGSIDKEGLNSIISVGIKTKYAPIELGLGIQTIFTSKYVDKYEREQHSSSIKLDYFDAQLQAQYLVNIGDKLQLLGGIHGGYLYRQFGSSYIYGIIATTRRWLTKKQKLGITISIAEDMRKDINKWRLNGRGGLTYNL